MKRFWEALRYWWHLPNIKLIEDYQRIFPNHCFICSMYRYQRRDLCLNEPTPPHEGCKEGNGSGGNTETQMPMKPICKVHQDGRAALAEADDKVKP